MKKEGWMKFWRVLGLLVLVFLSVIGAQLLIGLPLAFLVPTEVLETPIVNTLYSVVSYILVIILVIYLPPKILKKKIRPSSRESLGLSGLPTWTDIGLSIPGYIVSILLGMGLTFLFTFMPWFNADEAQELGYTPYMVGFERVISYLLLAVIAPICEELVFRGFLYGKLRILVPKWLAIILTSLLFGIIHLQWNVGVVVFAMSIITCILREVTGTIYAGMLVHIINNSVAFYLVYVIGIM